MVKMALFIPPQRQPNQMRNQLLFPASDCMKRFEERRMVMHMRMRIDLEDIDAAARRDDEVYRAQMPHGEAVPNRFDNIPNLALLLLAEIRRNRMLIIAGHLILEIEDARMLVHLRIRTHLDRHHRIMLMISEAFDEAGDDFLSCYIFLNDDIRRIYAGMIDGIHELLEIASNRDAYR